MTPERYDELVSDLLTILQELSLEAPYVASRMMAKDLQPTVRNLVRRVVMAPIVTP